MKPRAISRARLADVCLEIDDGGSPPEIQDRGEDDNGAFVRLVDGTMLRRNDRGNWYYRGWSKAGRRRGLDRIRPDDVDPAAILRGYGIDLGDHPDTIAGRCYSCGQDLPPNGHCPC
jgi:hypothetical protein